MMKKGILILMLIVGLIGFNCSFASFIRNSSPDKVCIRGFYKAPSSNDWKFFLGELLPGKNYTPEGGGKEITRLFVWTPNWSAFQWINYCASLGGREHCYYNTPSGQRSVIQKSHWINIIKNNAQIQCSHHK